jgi:hypothetical protein
MVAYLIDRAFIRIARNAFVTVGFAPPIHAIFLPMGLTHLPR